MVTRQGFSCLAIVLVAAMAWHPAAAETLGPISEETPPAGCDPGSFVSGIRCTGSYCDNMRISCARFRNAALGRATWTGWVSEEQGVLLCPQNHLIAGMACNGRYCDNISLHCVEVTNMTAVNCTDSRSVSEEQGGSLSFQEMTDKAGQMMFATGVRCSGRYCDNKSFRVCEVSGR